MQLEACQPICWPKPLSRCAASAVLPSVSLGCAEGLSTRMQIPETRNLNTPGIALIAALHELRCAMGRAG